MWPFLREYGYQLLITLDQSLNVVFLGTADETFSSRCYRTRYIPFFNVAQKVVNTIFYPFQGPGHCENAYFKEVLGRHLSQRFYEEAIRMNIAFDAEHLGADIRMPQ